MVAGDDQIALAVQAVEVGEDLGEQAVEIVQGIVIGIGLALGPAIRPGRRGALVAIVLRIGQVRGAQVEHHEVARRPPLFVEDLQQGTVLALQEAQRMVLAGDGDVQVATAQVRQQLGFLGRQPVGAKAGGLGEAKQVDLAAAQASVLARFADRIEQVGQAHVGGHPCRHAGADQRLGIGRQIGRQLWRGIARIAKGAQAIAAQGIGHHQPYVPRAAGHLGQSIGRIGGGRQDNVVTPGQAHRPGGKGVEAVVQAAARGAGHEGIEIAIGGAIGFGQQHRGDQDQRPATGRQRHPAGQLKMQGDQQSIGQPHAQQHRPVFGQTEPQRLAHLRGVAQQGLDVDGAERLAEETQVAQLQQLHQGESQQDERRQARQIAQPERQAEHPERGHVTRFQLGAVVWREALLQEVVGQQQQATQTAQEQQIAPGSPARGAGAGEGCEQHQGARRPREGRLGKAIMSGLRRQGAATLRGEP